MNKLVKKISVGILGVTLCGSILPTVNSFSVHADTNQEINNITNFIKRKISRSEFDEIVSIGVTNYNLSYEESERLAYTIYKDNLDFIYIMPRASFWTDKGLTVEGAAFLIDSALAAVLGAGFKEALKKLYYNKNKAMLLNVSRVVRQKLIDAGAGAMAGYVVGLFSVFQFILEPGMTAAKWWDSRDAYPNNGHINF